MAEAALSGGFFGGLADGMSERRTQALAEQKQKSLDDNKAKEFAVQQIDATIKHINDVFKAAADAGNDPKAIVATVQPLADSAKGLAAAAGINPAMIDQTIGALAARPPVSDTTKHTLTRVTGQPGEPDIVLQHEQSTGKVTRIDPKTGQPILAQSDVITPGQAAAVNPPGAPGVPPVATAPASPASVAAAPDGTPAQTVSARFPNPAQPVQATPAPAVPIGPTLPPNMQPGSEAIDFAIKNNIHGTEFLKALPPQASNIVQGIAEYKISPESVSKRGNQQAVFQGWARQLTNGEYDPKWYKPMQQTIKEFTSGGQTSPAGQITVGNTAIAHGAQVADAIDKLKAVPGLLQRMESSNTPFVSYAAAQLKNQSIRGTSEGAALSAFLTASHHFVDETTKFYAGGQPAEAGRERGLENFNGAKSAAELYQALNSEAELLSGKVDAMQDRWKNAMAGPKGLGDLMLRNAIPDFPVISEKSKAALDRIGQGYLATKFKDQAPAAGVVDFRTYFGNQ